MEEERKDYFEIKEKGVYNLPITHARTRTEKERERERERDSKLKACSVIDLFSTE
jgi:hypothetical protein